jgi:transcription-repair coupling factor (superfamily II helicase)
MSLAGLLDAVAADPALARALQAAGTPAADARTLDVTAPGGLRPFVVAALAARAGVPVLAITATQRETDELVAAVGSLLPGGPAAVAELPSWETLPHERLSPRADTVGRRLQVLRRITHPGAEGLPPLQVVVCPARSLLQPLVAGLGDVEPVVVRTGDELDGGLDGLVDRLSALGYVRVELVERRGEFAVRGGLVDVFPPTEEHPLRVELFGDEADSVRAFAVADQRSLPKEFTPAHGLVAPPCRELLLTEVVRARAKALIPTHPTLLDVLDKLAIGIPVDGMEALTPVLAERLELLTDVMPAGTVVVLCDPEKVRARAAELTATSQEFLAASWAVDLGAAAYRSLAEVREHAIATGVRWWSVTPFSAGPEGDDDDTVVSPARPVEAYRGEISRAVEDVAGWLSDGWSVVLTSEGHGSAQRMAETLREADLGVRYDDGGCGERPEPRIATVCCSSLSTGFTDSVLRLALLTERDLAGARGVTQDRSARKMPARRRNAVDPLALKAGDHVVHDKHGVGKFVGMERRVVLGGDREYLVLEYASSKRGQPADQLRVPTDQLDQLSRYSGGEAPTLNKLGGTDWAKTKGRARKAVKEIAGELIRLYAARTSAPGHAFGPDTPWQRELEDAFPYVETPDQRSAIDEVKADMEKPVPMDRVVCGDVGYGKTEIAVRAVFKAVMDGKQALVLCPTTLLAQQHLQTFSERYAQFPVKVRGLSRFTPDKEARETLKGLAGGEVDVVIGTHRLLQDGVKVKDLGLVVVDEEQRFGVEHKEKLKTLRTNVDVLTMSATPIPRTLEMAVTGIRELSTIDTPPEERHPVLTFVGPQDDAQIKAAIRRELLRDGQVFYLHNRVESIDRVASHLRDLVPEARIAVAHGQMGEDQLEQMMLAFWEREIDVLVCTTIVENGIDVSNANTLVVERSDALGLSQLHQLRGRVGRGRERAYAYFLYPVDKPMTETAHDRLATIAQHSELGGGMAVAMKDLEIRGAGNLLGGEQSGQIAAVGFDLYVRLVGEAVAEFKGEPLKEAEETKIDLPVDAYLSPEYVPVERLRLEAYRALAAAETTEALDAVRDELADRYGPPPPPVENLLAVAAFRIKVRSHGVGEVQQLGRQIRFTPVVLRESQTLRLQRLYKGAVVKPAASVILVPAPVPPLRDTALLAWAGDLLEAVLDPPVVVEPAAPVAATATA